MRRHIHYAWFICLAGVLMNFCSVGLVANVFSVYQPFIIKLNHFSNTQGSLLLTFRVLSAMVSLLLIDRYYHWLNIKAGAFFSILSIAISCFLYAFASSYSGYVIAAMVSGIGYSLGAMIPCSIIVGRWFCSHRGLALGLCSAGSGVATVIMPGIITTLILHASLQQAFLTEGFLVVFMAVAIFFLLRNDPYSINLLPLGYRNSSPQSESVKNSHLFLNRKECILALLLMFILGGSGNNSYTHLGVLFTSVHYDASEIAVIISVSGILLGLGKCIYGYVNDRIGTYRSNYLFGALLILGMCGFFLSFLHNPLILWLGMVAMGIGFPVMNVGMPLWARDFSPASSYSKTLKNYQLACTGGTLAFSFLPGLTADLLGSYLPIYVFFTGMMVLFIVGLQRLYQKIM